MIDFLISAGNVILGMGLMFYAGRLYERRNMAGMLDRLAWLRKQYEEELNGRS